MNIEISQKKLIAIVIVLGASVIVAIVWPVAIIGGLVGIAAGYLLRPRIEPVLKLLLSSKKDKRIRELEAKVEELTKKPEGKA